MTARWLSRNAVLAIHAEQLAEHGGAFGLRDAGLLDSALARPRNRAGYSEPDAPEIAATYAFGLVRNHPFVDGNKRTGFVVAATFLAINGHELAATEAEVVTAVWQLAEGALSEPELATWFRRRIAPQAGSP
jgi:death on curing protein